MSKGAATREAIVGEALRQASRVGFEGLSLAPLAESLNLSKSGLFAHFRSKEALQLEILEEAIRRFRHQVVAPAHRETSSVLRLRALFSHYLDWIAGTPRDGGCLFVAIAQEFDDRPGPLRDRLASALSEWRAYLAGVVTEGIGSGEFRAEADADQFAFEFVGAALSYQQASKLLDDPRARARALVAFEQLMTAMSEPGRT